MSRTLNGNSLSQGYAVGKVFKYVPYSADFVRMRIRKDQVTENIQAFLAARERASKELENIISASDKETASVFQAHMMMLTDPEIESEVISQIESGKCFSWAVSDVFIKYEETLSHSSDESIKERINDMKDIEARIIRCANQKKENRLTDLEDNTIIIASMLYPSDTATMDHSRISGILTENGGMTSHTAIIARSYGIPAISGINGLLKVIKTGDEVAIDAVAGKVFVHPAPELKADIQLKAEALVKVRKDSSGIIGVPTVTLDGTRIDMLANIGTSSDSELDFVRNVDGIGLLRTEFLYMQSPTFPSEQQQFEAYRKVLEHAGTNPVSFRTIDIGGDKVLKYWKLPEELNPSMGLRSLRLCFAYPEVFKTQLRALLRSSVHGNLQIMFPMVGTLEDFQRALTILEQCRKELDQAGVPYSDSVKTGVMIEIPSAAIIADKLAEIADFASIGTNDLVQYTLAVDRMNTDIDSYYQQFNPSVLMLVERAVKAFQAAGKSICVCGEMAGTQYGAAILTGLGLRSLSMDRSRLESIRNLMCRCTIESLSSMAQQALKCSSQDEVLRIVSQSLPQ